MEAQRTIKKDCHFSGKGIHTGVYTNMTISPAKENTGIVFIRTDKNNIEIKANINNVISTNRSTNLSKDNIEIRTVEHILAAIKGNNIDNVIIQVDNIEIPILDGSSKDFSNKIQEIGTIKQNANKVFYYIKKKIEYLDEKSGTKIAIYPDKEFSVDVTIDYNSNALGVQNYHLKNLKDYWRQSLLPTTL